MINNTIKVLNRFNTTVINNSGISVNNNCFRYMSILSKRNQENSPTELRPSSKVRKDIIKERNPKTTTTTINDDDDKLKKKNQLELYLDEEKARDRLSKQHDKVHQKEVDSDYKEINYRDPNDNTVFGQAIKNMDTPSSQYDEYLHRLMIEDINENRKKEQYIHNLVTKLPEWNNYNNEVLRGLEQLEIDFLNYEGVETKMTYKYWEERRIQMVEGIRRKHYRVVSKAIDKLLDEEIAKQEQEKEDFKQQIIKDTGLNEDTLMTNKNFNQMFSNTKSTSTLDQLFNQKDEMDSMIEEALRESGIRGEIPQGIKEMFKQLNASSAQQSFTTEDDEFEHSFIKAATKQQEQLQYKSAEFDHQVEQQQQEEIPQNYNTSSSLQNDDDDFNLKDILANMSSKK